MAKHLKSRIHEIIARAAREIERAARHGIASDVLSVLGANRSPAPPKATKAPAAPKAKAASRRRGVDTADLDRVLEAITRNPGARTEQIYAKSGVRPATAKKALKKLRALGAVRTEGQRRGTTYHLAGPASGAPKRRGRPPRIATPVATTPAGKKPRSDRSYSVAEIDRTLRLIQARPGLRAEQIYGELRLGANKGGKVLAYLRERGSVKIKGFGRGTTYAAD